MSDATIIRKTRLNVNMHVEDIALFDASDGLGFGCVIIWNASGPSGNAVLLSCLNDFQTPPYSSTEHA